MKRIFFALALLIMSLAVSAQRVSADKITLKAGGQIEGKTGASINLGSYTINGFSNDPALGDSSTLQLVTEAAAKAYADTKGVVDSLVLLQDSILVAYDAGGTEVFRDTIKGVVGGVTDGDKGDITVSGSGTTWNIDASSVTTTEILDGTIVAGDIATGAVTTTEILDATITANDIATGAVTTTEILDGTITAADMATLPTSTSVIASENISLIDSLITFQGFVDQLIDTMSVDTILSNTAIDSSTLKSLLKNRINILVSLSLSDTVTQNYTLLIPDVADVSNDKTHIFISGEYETDDYNYILTTNDEKISIGNDILINNYVLEDGEQVTLSKKSGIWQLTSNRKDSKKYAFRSRKYQLGEKFGKYIVEATPHLNWNSGVADSVFSIPVTPKFTSEPNIVLGSDDLSSGGWLALGGSPFAIKVSQKGETPWGNSSYFKYTSTQSSVRIRTPVLNTPDVEVGTQFTIKAWLRKDPDSPDITFSAQTGFLQGTANVPTTVVSSAEWREYELLMTYTAGYTGGALVMDLKFEGGIGAEFYVGRVNIYRSDEAGEMVKSSSTTPSSSVYYLNYYPQGNRVNFRDIIKRENDRKTAQNILNFCEETELCNELHFDVNVRIDSTVIVNHGQRVSGNANGWSENTDQVIIPDKIIFTPPDGVNNLDLFKVNVQDADNTTRQAKGVVFSNLYITATDTCNYLINLGNPVKSRVENCELNADYKAYGGIYVGRSGITGEAGVDALMFKCVNTFVNEARGISLLSEESNYIRIESFASLRSDSLGLSIYGRGGSIESGWFENCGHEAIVSNGTLLDIRNSYFESNGNDTCRADIWVNDTDVFQLSHANFNVKGTGHPNIRVYLDDVRKVFLLQNRVSEGILYTETDNTKSISEVNTLLSYRDDEAQPKTTFENLLVYDNDIEQSRVETTRFQNDNTVSELYLYGRRQNWTLRSDSLILLDNDFTMVSDSLLDPLSGDKRVEYFRLDSALISDANFINAVGSGTMVIGDYYTISFYAWTIGATADMTIYTRNGSDTGTSASHTITSTPKRYTNTFQAVSTAGPGIQLRVANNTAVGSEFAISNIQINEGRFALGYSRTTGSVIDDSIAIIDIQNEMRFTGDKLTSNTLTDIQLTASDSVTLNASGSSFTMNSGFTRLYDGANIVMQVNNGTGAFTWNVGDNNSNAFIANVLGGGQFFQHDSTDGAEVTSIGSSTTGAKVEVDAPFVLKSFTATEASALTPANGMMIYVTDTDATFTSVGFWGYENGAWTKL